MSLVEQVGVWRLRRAGFVRRDLETSEGRVATWVRPGHGVPVVMLHGVSGRGSHYLPLIEQVLRELGTIVLPDFPGHGESGLPRSMNHIKALYRGVAEAIDQALDEPFVLYGNSMGGYAALKYAAAHPERVLGLLVSSPAGGVLSDELRTEVSSRFLVNDWSEGRALAARALPASSPLLHWVVGLNKSRQLSRPHIRQLLTSIDGSDDLTPEELARLPAITHILWGTREDLLHPDQRTWFLETLPEHVVFDEPEGLGHSSYFEHTGLIAERLREVLREVEAASS